MGVRRCNADLMCENLRLKKVGAKRCRWCGLVLDLSEFGFRMINNGKGQTYPGVFSECKSCRRVKGSRS